MKNRFKIFLASAIIAGSIFVSLSFGRGNSNNLSGLCKDGFSIQVSDYYCNDRKYYLSEVWSHSNKEEDPSSRLDGDVDISYQYMPANVAGRGSPAQWNKVVHRWKRKTAGNGLYSSRETGSEYHLNVSENDIPGNPENIPKNIHYEFRMDFDKGEEYARGLFINKSSAEQWAERMVNVFKKQS